VDSTKVSYCVEDALADLERQGHLNVSDVQLLIDQHGLDGAGTAAVFAALHEQGIKLREDTDTDGPIPFEAPGVNKATRDTLGLMLRSAGRTKLLTADEEVVLGRRIRIGRDLEELDPHPAPGSLEARQIADGRRAHDHLVLANLRLVVSIARRYRPIGMDLSDIIQEGTIGLMRAADKFDHTLGFKFSTYASWWIRQAITRGLADKGRLVRLPVHMVEKLQKISATQNRLRTALDREPTVEEIGREVGMEPGAVRGILDVAREPLSIDQPIGEDGDTDLSAILDLYAADVAEAVIRSLTNARIRDALDSISIHQEATSKGATAHAIDMLKLRYGLDDDQEHTLDQIGAEYGITRERARQILNKIIASPQLRNPLTALTASD
jgi:RNA polymerase sigma factor (sigma-70 family)